MSSVKRNTSISEYQKFVNNVYSVPNMRHFSINDMLTNILRYSMRGIKGIRKKNQEKIRKQLIVALSWFMSTMNQLSINVEDEVWKRFPYQCSYCGSCPCSCKINKVDSRMKLTVDDQKHPKTLEGFQNMFNEIYPASERRIEDAGIHLAEECGEFSEAILNYRGKHEENDFKEIVLEGADLFSCLMGVFNSANINVADVLSNQFSNNCHACHKIPCECSFAYITSIKS